MTEHDPVRAGLRALLSDIASHKAQTARECEMTQGTLDLYVSDELDGLDARARHPDLWRHLQGCPGCRAEHDSLLALLTAEAQGELPALPPRPAAVAAPAQAPWQVRFPVGQTPAAPALTFVFAPAYLRQSLRPASAGQGARLAPGRMASPGDALLLSYLGETSLGETLVQLYARPAPDDATHCLLTVVAAAEPLPQAAVLVWGGEEFTIPLSPDGDGRFAPVPFAALEAANPTAEGFALRLLA